MKPIYNLFMKRTSTYAVAIVGSVFFFERGFDMIAESIFENVNKGVSLHDYLINNFVNSRVFSETVEGYQGKVRAISPMMLD